MSKIDIFNTDKKYNIIYADPAWSYGTTKQVIPSRAKKQAYVPMRMVDIFDMDISKICADNCVLFLWATFPLLPEALFLIKQWGFEYKTNAFTWVKKNKKEDSYFWGMGSWTRSNAEICLMATKGNPKKASSSVHSIIDSKIEEHSKKPAVVRDKIVELCGDLPRIELFARQYADGWDCWGNEV